MARTPNIDALHLCCGTLVENHLYNSPATFIGGHWQPETCSPVQKPGSKTLKDFDGTAKKAGAGNSSEQYNESDPSTRSPDGSDVDTLSQDGSDDISLNKGPMNPCYRTAPAIQPMPPPPGLYVPPGLDASCGPKAPGTRLRSQARAFVPSCASFAPHEAVQQQANDEAILQKALKKLSPGEELVLRSLMESKVQEELVLQSLVERKDEEQTPCHNELIGWTHANAAPVCSPTFWPFVPAAPQAFCPMLAHSQLQRPPGVFAALGPPQRPPGVLARKPPGVFANGPLEKQPDETEDTLTTILHDLSLMDSRRIFVVRNIHHLGMDSAAVLETYFSQFGNIERVMVSHWRSKTSGQMKLRAATVGFLVMSKAEDVEAVLAFGQDHCVKGVAVSTRPFREAHS